MRRLSRLLGGFARAVDRRDGHAFARRSQHRNDDPLAIGDAFAEEHFVSRGLRWAHVDLAASQRTGGLGHINTEITGFGVRFAVNFLLEQKLPKEQA